MYRYKEKTPPKLVLAFAIVYLCILALVRLAQGRTPSTGEEWLSLAYLHGAILLVILVPARFLVGFRYRIRITDTEVMYYRIRTPLSELDPASVAQARVEADWTEAERRAAHWPDESEKSLAVRDLELSNVSNRIRREMERLRPDQVEQLADLREQAKELGAESNRLHYQKMFHHPRKGLESAILHKKDGSMILFYTDSAREFTRALSEALGRAAS
ncbi:hypothetical protein L0U85_14555 [Glycomyces sp. L485]|uniref:hypothetical protein n=1 Tax=Glycomyces sp. L485 TaxID=2909235 RepID=UPI001F4B7159|nr:hypothetical protein [Glycomyces sp. L485]MCH7232067.1 hypothetical protein [Glycomyces sp. L485]